MADGPEEKKSGGVPEYMLTYGDMMTLLLCFFVLLFSFSSTEKKSFNYMLSSFKGAMFIFQGAKDYSVDKAMMEVKNVKAKKREKDQTSQASEPLETMTKLKEKIVKILEKETVQGEIKIISNDRGDLIIRIRDKLLFDVGKSTLKPEAYKILDEIFKVISKIKNRLVVQGHTDDTPIHTRRFETSWELSCARAINVVRFYVEKLHLSPSRISAEGFGSFSPIASNSTEDGKAQNRRVELIVKREKIPDRTFERVIQFQEN